MASALLSLALALSGFWRRVEPGTRRRRGSRSRLGSRRDRPQISPDQTRTAPARHKARRPQPPPAHPVPCPERRAWCGLATRRGARSHAPRIHPAQIRPAPWNAQAGSGSNMVVTYLAKTAAFDALNLTRKYTKRFDSHFSRNTLSHIGTPRSHQNAARARGVQRRQRRWFRVDAA